MYDTETRGDRLDSHGLPPSTRSLSVAGEPRPAEQGAPVSRQRTSPPGQRPPNGLEPPSADAKARQRLRRLTSGVDERHLREARSIIAYPVFEKTCIVAGKNVKSRGKRQRYTDRAGVQPKALTDFGLQPHSRM